MAPILFHGLNQLGLPVVCVESRQAYQALKSPATHKTDRNDARGLAHLARTGFFKPVHVKSLSAHDGLTDYERQALLAVLELFRSTTAQYLTPEAGLNRRPDCRSPTRSDSSFRPECANSSHSRQLGESAKSTLCCPTVPAQ